MQKRKFLLGVIITLVVAFLGFRIFQQETIADFIRPLLLPLVTIFYWISGFKKTSYFFFFLLIYSIAEFVGLFYYYMPATDLVDNLMYFGCNLLYILAYIFLIMEVMRTLPVAETFNRFAIHIIILLILDVYCIMLVSDVAIKSESLVTIYDHALEIVYNAVIMVLLTITLINYLARDSKKAMNLLLGSLCIVFSEVIQVAYFYVSEINILGIVYIVLLVLAFCFFYMQASMSYNQEEPLFDHSVNEIEV
ncbi:MAG: hypothetical protein KJO41_03730 [Bacteroidia bacterium]|nr:hypothetical protein [Bacteroidia bacterium]MBT8278087.1 hypothetical protein [Bacteroidia bacterium]NND26331.1 hypothetical protein [Flavobacteriaceae bacterium]NNK59599.1 hypothetical protein [Flavobacteriaceae bacterium]NNL33680.1 hypothetical protein [Flavobacteriaceae bacterium]